MKLTAQLKLKPTPEQRQALADTLREVNAACNFISSTEWERRVFSQFRLHRLTYYEVRSRFHLSAQMTVGALSKVADAYKLDRRAFRKFRPNGAICYDSRVLRYLKDSQVSIWTTKGRQRISYDCGEGQRELLVTQKGESDPPFVGGEFYLSAACEVKEKTRSEYQDALGVDLGIVNVAVDSDGRFHTGEKVRKLRRRQVRLRAKLQKKGTKSAKRLLRR